MGYNHVMENIKWIQTGRLEGLYDVNQRGEIRNKYGKQIKNFDTNNCGYTRVAVRIGGKLRREFVHRLVAEAFVDNPHCLAQVNHIDGNKNNNEVANLAWASPSENVKHAIDNGLLVPNTTGMVEHNKKNGVWNKGLKTGNQYTCKK